MGPTFENQRPAEGSIETLGQLNEVVRHLLSRGSVLDDIRDLKEAIRTSDQPFVWSVLDLTALHCEPPASIRSGWIFVLKRDVGSGCHYHPNSIQRMVMIEGQGESNVAGQRKRMAQFGSPDHALEETWYVIREHVPHEFFPEEEDMVVLSFHTAGASDLEEVSCVTGERRQYEESH